MVQQLLARAGRGPEARALLSYPWEDTPLGPVEAWPDELRQQVTVMLCSEFPMMIAWGPEYIQLYNDAFRPILGSGKHPAAMGRSARDTWAEIWDDIGPLFARVFEGESVKNVDQRLMVNRNGYPEEVFFTYSYSPIYTGSDSVAGLLAVATETTDQIVDRRRLLCVSSLASALVGATSIESIAEATIESLKDSDVNQVVEINVIVGGNTVRIASLPGHRTQGPDRTRLQEIVTAGVPVVLDEGWVPGLPAERVAFGIDNPKLRTVVVVATNPNRVFDDQYQQFVQLIRRTLSSSMAAALLRAEELGALRHVSETLQHAMLELASDLPTVAARYLPKASNLTVGGDWYDVIALGEGHRGLIVGDCVGHGLEAATAMGALRNVSRALLGDGDGPAEVLDSLHRFATTMPAATYATVVCAIVDLPAQTITYSNAGHPPPLLVHDGEMTWLDQARTTPLAFADPERCEATVDVTPGDLLVLYTDGLVERRGENIELGLQRLAGCAVACWQEPVQHIADRLIAELVGSTPRDDVALVVKRIH